MFPTTGFKGIFESMVEATSKLGPNVVVLLCALGAASWCHGTLIASALAENTPGGSALRDSALAKNKDSAWTAFSKRVGPLQAISVVCTGAESFEIHIKGEHLDRSSIFALPSPRRLVVDLPTSAMPSGKYPGKLRPAFRGACSLAQIRLAAHPDKLRLVFDISAAGNSPSRGQSEISSPEPTFTVSMNAQELALVVHTVVGTGVQTAGDDAKHLPAPVAESTAVPLTITVPPTTTTAKPTLIVVPTDAAPSPTPAPNQSNASPTVAPPAFTLTALPRVVTPPSNEAAVALPDKAPPLLVGQALRSIRFENLARLEAPGKTDQPPSSRTPALVFTMQERPQFRLARKDDKTFRLIVPDCKLAGAAVGLPYFPPQDFVGFTVTSAVQTEKDCDIEIGTERGVRLNAAPVEYTIVVTLVR